MKYDYNKKKQINKQHDYFITKNTSTMGIQTNKNESYLRCTTCTNAKSPTTRPHVTKHIILYLHKIQIHLYLGLYIFARIFKTTLNHCSMNSLLRQGCIISLCLRKVEFSFGYTAFLIPNELY